MSIGSWDPSSTNNETPFEFDRELLRKVISLVEANNLDAIASVIPGEQRQQQSRMMTLSRETWFEEAENYSSEELIQLIRFFTLAEMQIPGWEAGEKSPVIWLVKALRQRGTPASKELKLWIKSNTTNKFLPNGPLL